MPFLPHQVVIGPSTMLPLMSFAGSRLIKLRLSIPHQAKNVRKVCIVGPFWLHAVSIWGIPSSDGTTPYRQTAILPLRGGPAGLPTDWLMPSYTTQGCFSDRKYLSSA